MSRSLPLNESIGPVVGSTFLSQLGTFSPILLGGSLLTYIFFLTVQFGPVGIIFGALGIRKALEYKDPSLRKIIPCHSTLTQFLYHFITANIHRVPSSLNRFFSRRQLD